MNTQNNAKTYRFNQFYKLLAFKYNMRYQKIKDLVEQVIEPSILFIKRTRKRSNMPYRDIETLIKIYFPRTKYYERRNGFYKHIYIIHSHKNKVVLKIGRNKKDIRKDYVTYTKLPKNIRNRYFAKIYWRHNQFMLQKFGKKVKVPDTEISRLKKIGMKYKLRDIRGANIMKFGKTFKIIDAERRS